MILSDKTIKRLAEGGMIEPFNPALLRRADEGINQVSHGLSSYGYDVTAAAEFQIFTNANATVIDPKGFDASALIEPEYHRDERGLYIIAPPHSFVLARTVEYIRMPRNIVGLMTVKSTYARCGLLSPPTVLEPEWEGEITIEISNTTPLPARIYAKEGIAQVLFFLGDYACEVSYKDRRGKYQCQTGVTLPK